MPDRLLVRAVMVEPIAGDELPQLDALLEGALAPYHPKSDPGYKIDRRLPPPAPGKVPIPLARRWVVVGPEGAAHGRISDYRCGDPVPDLSREPGATAHLVGLCSDPILGVVLSESVDHVNKRIGVERAADLDPSARHVVSTTNSWTKSYRLPLRRRLVSEVHWLARAKRKNLIDALKHVVATGKKRSIGHGRVRQWVVDRLEDSQDGPLWPWWITTEHGPLLMKTLPIGDYLPPDLIGSRRDFGGASPPYWHPSRFCPIVKPC